MARRRFGFGIVGCGMIAGFHARAIAELARGRLVACHSRSPAKTAQFAGEWNCQAYDDLDAMLANPEVDVVTICTPSGAHLEPAVAAARAKKHVVVEKPLEITLARCDALIDACRKNGVKLATIFPSRFHAASGQLKAAVDAGRFGRLTLCEAYVKWHRTQAYYDSGAWRGTWQLDGGGALMNQAIHSVDLLQWMAGPVAEIRAQVATLAHERIAVEDTAVATLRFTSGALGVIEATTAAWPGYLKRIELHGSTGSAAMEEEDVVAWDFAKTRKSDAKIREQMAGRISTGGGAGNPSAIGYHGHARQLADFLEAIDKSRPPAIDGAEGRKAVEIILAIYQAAETGRPVSLPLPRDPKLKMRL
ncbi:MAG TPA: Gfo/Idh/MocA family oxidoreductase [Pirellulales bacterium]|nr:Gfo/Idh/MocA family oxidoreductase [Pirellulales bacterium]